MGTVYSSIIGQSISRKGYAFAVVGSLALLAGCTDGGMPDFLKGQQRSEVGQGLGVSQTSERDVEAPEVFQAKEAGLWDGRPSLGGVWVAHPNVKDPERVIVRNETNGKFVIAALFRREREAPGPRLQVSSDAAAALGILAGQPTNLDVVALRREEVVVDAPAVPAAVDVDAQALDPVAEVASAAIDAVAAAPIASPKPKPKPAAKPAKSSLSKPYVQLGLFSVEQNAKNTAADMRKRGMVPTIKTQQFKGKTFYRVLVGPAQTKSEVSSLLKTIKAAGFADAYAVSG
jgi:cell division septation protein DedD